MVTFNILGEVCELHGASYCCPALRLYGFATERKLAGAIRRKRNTNAPRRKIDEQAYGVQGRGPDAEDFEGADR
jgi:hypothetical protein